jgi:3-phenylpropionate/trans-cinnamate dioxygenase ferredoxin reductase component
MPEPIVIVGAGQGAAKAVETLRGAGYDGALVVLGDEPYPPYQRPPLSKKYLAGEMDAAALQLKGPDYYATHGVDLRLDAPAAAIEPAARRLVLRSGAALPYSKLLIATGARSRRLSLAGADRLGVFTLRGITAVDAIRAGLAQAERVVVIGGGYIGLEVAAVACTRGHRVTVLEGQSRVMARVVSPEVSRYFENLHRARGVDLRTGVAIESIVGRERVEGVRLVDGSTVAADLVLVAVGAMPNAELAEAAGISVADGILVDAAARTAAPDVYACGDCTRFHSRRYGRSIRLESVQNAIDQGRVAALAMLGEAQDYDPAPWFWSDQYEIKLQIAGLSDGYDRSTREEAPGGGFAVSYFAGERLLAVDAINAARAHMLARRALAVGTEAAPARPDAATR